VTINFVMSVCMSVWLAGWLSVHLHGTAQLPLDRYFWN